MCKRCGTVTVRDGEYFYSRGLFTIQCANEAQARAWKEDHCTYLSTGRYPTRPNPRHSVVGTRVTQAVREAQQAVDDLEDVINPETPEGRRAVLQLVRDGHSKKSLSRVLGYPVDYIADAIFSAKIEEQQIDRYEKAGRELVDLLGG